MLIGIVSKDEHIKNHAQALRKDGYDVIGLGCSPTEIPPTVDLIILRTQSCSHGGSATAFSWSRSTKKPIIVENGLTGIRSKLRVYALSNNTPPKEETPMVATPQILTYIHTLPEYLGVPSWDKVLPRHRVAWAFNEALPIFNGMSQNLREEIRTTYLKGSSGKNKGPHAPNISTFYSRPEYTLMEKLKGHPLHFFLVLQWVLLGNDAGVIPTVSGLQTAYMDFCGSKSLRNYAEAAVWIVQNGSKPSQPALPAEEIPLTEAKLCELDRVFDELIEDSPAPVVQESQKVSPEAPPVPALDLAGVRRDLEDFVLEVAGTNTEILNLVKALRDEVKALRDEVKALRADGTSQDSLKALEDLRDRGAVVSITFGSK